MSFLTRVLESERTYFQHALFVSRFHQAPGLSGSQSLEVRSGAENKAARPGELLEPSPQLGRVKSLHEMPGPNTLYNLYEFFWKDGFGRIHEIQVWLSWLFRALFTSDYRTFPFLPSQNVA